MSILSLLLGVSRVISYELLKPELHFDENTDIAHISSHFYHNKGSTGRQNSCRGSGCANDL